jgi:hypothetical protein
MKTLNTLVVYAYIFIVACQKESGKPVAISSDTKTENVISKYSIGEHFGGGIIFYLDSTFKHGLITSDHDLDAGLWYAGVRLNTHAKDSVIGAGLCNTKKIVKAQGANGVNYAAWQCDTFTAGGYKDWFLPSRDELNQLYLHRDAIGVYTLSAYWSSTESGKGHAWAQDFTNGLQTNDKKTIGRFIRAVRVF